MLTVTEKIPVRSEPPISSNSLLEQGDRLTRAEFERRYQAMSRVKKAEFIEGVVHLPSPVSSRHAEPHAKLMGWLAAYYTATPSLRFCDNVTVRLDLDNEYQPDALLMIDPKHGGQARVDEDGYISGGPEFVAEVASSSASIDLHDKLKVYRRNQVREYLVWRVLDGAIDWFTLRDGEYVPLAASEDGVLRSLVFPGLWLDAATLLRGDLAGVFVRLQQGIASPEHASFVARLQQAASQ